MPSAWQVLLYERCGCTRAMTWDAWQALASSSWSTAISLRQQFLLFAHCPETANALARHGVTPARLLDVGPNPTL